MKRRNQRGAVLVVSLLLLTVMTMLVISSVNTGTINLRILNNMRAQQEAQAITQLAVEEFVSEPTNFDPPQSATVTKGDHTVTITEPQCVATRPADGYSAKWGLTPEDTTWEFEATISHTEGAGASIQQGVEIRMPADSCPGSA